MEVDPCDDAQSAAEGAVLGLFDYDDLKTKKKFRVTTQLHGRYNYDHLSPCCHCLQNCFLKKAVEVNSVWTLLGRICMCSDRDHTSIMISVL